MLPVVLVLLGLFITGYAIVTLQRGVGQIVAGLSLLALSVSAALIPVAPSAPTPAAARHAPSFTMEVGSK